MRQPNGLSVKSIIKTLCSVTLCSTLLFNSAHASDSEQVVISPQQQAQFKKWITDFKLNALEKGISGKTLKQAFADITLSEKILNADRSQPEFTRTFFEYLNRAVSDTRIANGRKNYKAQQKLLTKLEQTYGIPGAYLVAFWGMETNYGSYTGNDPIIQSLATLAFDPRRSTFFSRELIAALRVLDRGDVKLTEMKGSWAGAMGQVQFMPSNYLKYAVDGDSDNKINLWASTPDALTSAANFLNKLGWKAGEEWGVEVKLPKNFNLAMADAKTKRTIQEWKKLGVTSVQGHELPKADKEAILVLPSDYRGPAFLAFDNFKVIKRWNNSTNYAIGVGYLADQIRKKAKLTKTQPEDDKGLSLSQMKEIQALLNRLSFHAGKPDGIAGSNTKNALRKFQQSIKVPADGYPSLRMLNYLRKAVKNG